ncbi:MAG: DUF502 domain-containing protein [Gammaproteobacteria bacterium]|nr:MAG: DUF502 domain-containing protein [Gammaproteobacteria bacterium]
MKKFEAFIKASILGGIVIVLPLAILAFFFNWLFTTITDLIQPMTDFVANRYSIPEITADIAVIVMVVIGCFIIGVIVSTTIGKFFYSWLDKYLLKHVPGYKIIKEVVIQFLGDKSSSLFTNGEVVRAQIFGKSVDTKVTGLLTCKHSDGTLTIFVPTGPNPTSGNIYHLPPEQVERFPDASIEDMMRSIIACGAGSEEVFSRKNSATQELPDE